MNYLAHIFLSGSDRQVQLGNFIGDAVKGSAYKDYPQAVANGILLHRSIDAYTDNHPAVKAVIRSLKPHFGRYSAIITDIYFDYLLASRFAEFSDITLKRYSRHFYFTIIRYYSILPGRFRRFMWHFIGTNRLYKYSTKSGIRRSLEIMIRVHSLEFSADDAILYLSGHEEELWNIFLPFFRELEVRCKTERITLSDTNTEP